MSYFIDEDGNDVEISFQDQAELYGESVLGSLSIQEDLIERETEFLTDRLADLKARLATEEDDSRKVSLSEQLKWSADALELVQGEVSGVERKKSAVKASLAEIVKEPEGWLLVEGEHEEWIAWHRSNIATVFSL